MRPPRARRRRPGCARTCRGYATPPGRRERITGTHALPDGRRPRACAHSRHCRMDSRRGRSRPITALLGARGLPKSGGRLGTGGSRAQGRQDRPAPSNVLSADNDADTSLLSMRFRMWLRSTFLRKFGGEASRSLGGCFGLFLRLYRPCPDGVRGVSVVGAGTVDEGPVLPHQRLASGAAAPAVTRMAWKATTHSDHGAIASGMSTTSVITAFHRIMREGSVTASKTASAGATMDRADRAATGGYLTMVMGDVDVGKSLSILPPNASTASSSGSPPLHTGVGRLGKGHGRRVAPIVPSGTQSSVGHAARDRRLC